MDKDFEDGRNYIKSETHREDKNYENTSANTGTNQKVYYKAENPHKYQGFDNHSNLLKEAGQNIKGNGYYSGSIYEDRDMEFEPMFSYSEYRMPELEKHDPLKTSNPKIKR